MKILIVEDEIVLAHYLQQALEKEGYQTAVFSSGEAALEAVCDLKPDLILMDIVLAGIMDGIETAGKIQSILDVPIIYLTGYDDQLSTDRAKRTNPLWCLLKPFRINELRIAVDMTLHRRRLEQQVQQLNRELERRVAERTEELLHANMALASEIEERRTGEAKLREAEELYRSLIEATPAIVFLVKLDGTLIYAGPETEKVLDLAVGSLLTEEILHEGDRSRVINEFLEAVAAGRIFHSEFRVMAPTCDYLWLLTKAAPIFDVNGKVIGYHGVSFDITEKKMAEEEGRVNAERLRAVFEATRDCIFIKDRQLRYLLVNPAFAALIGMAAEDISLRTDFDLYTPLVAQQLAKIDQRVLAGQSIEQEITREIRGVIWTFLESRAPVLNGSGEVIGVCGICKNITERQQTKAPSKADPVFQSKKMRETLALANVAARSDGIVLLSGESGVGKDHLAKYIHDASRRASGSFFAINCGALPPELAESELFGHESGSFTGARGRKRGLLELAEGGTLLLNEVGELPLRLQVKLLAFLDTRSFTRVGGERNINVDARLMAATNRNLEEEVAQGRFRSDLFYRLNVFAITIPPLRERVEDIPILAKLILTDLTVELQLTDPPNYTDASLALLKNYDWPGNIRELRNHLERSLILSVDPTADFKENVFNDSDGHETQPTLLTKGASMEEIVSDLEKQLISEALKKAGGRRQMAAELLGISRHTLKRHIQKLGLNGD